MRTTTSRSAYSHSMSKSRSRSANAVPDPIWDDAQSTVTLRGSSPVSVSPSDCISALTASARSTVFEKAAGAVISSQSFARSRDCKTRYEGLVEPNRHIASRAVSSKPSGAPAPMCRYPPPVRTGNVLWAESAQASAPSVIGWMSSGRNLRYAPWALSTSSSVPYR